MLRRGWIPAVLVVVIGALAWGLTRLSPRSPMLILAVCTLAVLTMKLVERRLRRWLQSLEPERGRTDHRGPGPRGPGAPRAS